MQPSEDMFPTDWSPPPVEFLAVKALQASSGAPAHSWVGTEGPRGLKRLACWLPREPELQDSDPKESLASLEEMRWSMAGPSQQAAAPVVDTCSEVGQRPPLWGHPSSVAPRPAFFGLLLLIVSSQLHTPNLPAALDPKAKVPLSLYFCS